MSWATRLPRFVMPRLSDWERAELDRELRRGVRSGGVIELPPSMPWWGINPVPNCRLVGIDHERTARLGYQVLRVRVRAQGVRVFVHEEPREPNGLDYRGG